jgi:hypothetical protein
MGALVERAGDPLLVVGDEAYVEANYAGQAMATSLLWSTAAWRESLARCRDIEREAGAEILLGHDLSVFESLR